MILMIPHFGVVGGAGKYIKSIASEISLKEEVFFAGSYKEEYSLSLYYLDWVYEYLLKKCVFPFYTGVNKYDSFSSLLKLVFLYPILFLLSFNFKRKLSKVNVLFFTSIIQIPQILIFRKLIPNTKICLLIQENVILDGFLGIVCVFLLRKFDVVVSINNFCLEGLSDKGVDSVLVVNSFNENHNNTVCDVLYDAVYVGGEQSIKGFQHVIHLFDFLSKSICVNIAMLGFYSESTINKINKINSAAANGSFMHVFGNVDSCDEFYMKSIFLILPITSPHFCRPAIEAGLFKKSFIISKLDGLSDFAIPDFNCLSFDCDDVESFSNAFKKLLDEKNRILLERNNYDFSLRFKSTYSIDKLLYKLGL